MDDHIDDGDPNARELRWWRLYGTDFVRWVCSDDDRYDEAVSDPARCGFIRAVLATADMAALLDVNDNGPATPAGGQWGNVGGAW